MAEQPLRSALDQAADWYRAKLLEQRPVPVTRLLHERGLGEMSTDTPAGRRWQLGYTPTGAGGNRLVTHLRGTGHDDQVLLAAGLAVPGRSGELVDLLRHRLVIPLRTALGWSGWSAADSTTATRRCRHG